MSWTIERARVASLSRSRTADDPELIAARARLKSARADEYVSRVIADAPPLTAEQRDAILAAFAGFTPTQRDRIASLLHPPGSSGPPPVSGETRAPNASGGTKSPTASGGSTSAETVLSQSRPIGRDAL